MLGVSLKKTSVHMKIRGSNGLPNGILVCHLLQTSSLDGSLRENKHCMQAVQESVAMADHLIRAVG